MKLLRCEIYNFGKFQGYKYEFDGKFDQILLPNGEGKTTLVSFIVCVFFGPKDETAQSLLKKYSPLFSQGSYGGEIDFIHKGVEYKLTHTFSKFGNSVKFKSETLKLLDKNDYSVEDSFENDCPIASLFKDVRKTTSSLLNTVIFTQDDMKNNKDDDPLNDLFLNQLNNLYDLQEYDDVCKALKDKTSLYGNRSNDSYGKKANDKLVVIERKINDEFNEKESLEKTLIEECGEDFESSFNSQIKEIDEEISNYKKASLELSEKITMAGPYSEYVNEKRRLQENEKSLKLLEKEITFNPLELNDTVLQEFRDESKQLSYYEGQIAELNYKRDGIQLDVSYEDASNDKEEIEKLYDLYLKDVQTKTNDLENKSTFNGKSSKNLKYSKIALVSGVVFLILAIIGVVLITTNFLAAGSSLLAIGAAGFIISIILTFYFRRKSGVHQKTESYSNYNSQGGTFIFYLESGQKLKNIFSKYQLNSADLTYNYNMFNYNLKNYQKNSSQRKALTEQIDNLKANYSNAKDQFETKLKKYGYTNHRFNSYDIFIDRLQSWFSSYKAAQENVNAGKKELDKPIYEGFDQIDEDEMDTHKLAAQINEIDRKKEELNEKKKNISSNYDKYCETLNKLDSLKKDRTDTEGEIEEIKKYSEFYQKGLVYLQKARNKIFSSSFEPFKMELMKILGKEKEKLFEYTEVEPRKDGTIGIIFKIPGKDNITSAYLSKGYQDYYKLAVRFSFLNMIYKDEKPFIILDDPFVNMDKDRLETVKKVVLDISKDYQIIYLCCHESRKFID